MIEMDGVRESENSVQPAWFDDNPNDADDDDDNILLFFVHFFSIFVLSFLFHLQLWLIL